MKCYICATQGINSDAVAICIVCGMAICRDHLVRSELPIKDVINWGLGEETYEYPQRLPRILCRECHIALQTKEKHS